jgi:hypothetical protein
MDSLKATGKEVKSRIASRPLSEEGASTLGSELGAPPGSEKITPKRSILEPNVEIGLKSAIGVRGRISTATLREIQLRETSTFSIHSNSSNRREICRESTRASFIPTLTPTFEFTVVAVGPFGTPLMLTDWTEKIEDQAKR